MFKISISSITCVVSQCKCITQEVKYTILWIGCVVFGYSIGFKPCFISVCHCIFLKGLWSKKLKLLCIIEDTSTHSCNRNNKEISQHTPRNERKGFLTRLFKASDYQVLVFTQQCLNLPLYDRKLPTNAKEVWCNLSWDY